MLNFSKFNFQVIDVNPSNNKNKFTDLSLVEKYELPDDEYAKRSGIIANCYLYLKIDDNDVKFLYLFFFCLIKKKINGSNRSNQV